MKKVFVLSAKIFSLTSVCLCLLLCFAACGGGGGGGASLPDSEYTTHNTGGWGGGGGSGGGGNSGSSNGTITGSTPLNVTEYTYNGQTYTSVEALKNAIAETAPAGQFSIPFTCTNASNETETRTARITKTVSGNNTEILIEHQYMASVTVNETPLTIPFYYNDGISLADIAAALGNETVGSGSDEVVFELQKLKIGGAEYGLNGSLPVSANGDVTLNSADIHGVYPKWGISTGNTIQFSSSLNEGDSVVINTTEPIIRIDNPDDKTISLDLRNMNTNNTTFIRNFINSPANVTDLVLPSNITTIADEALSNVTNLTSVVIPNNVQTIGENAFKDLENLQSVTLPTNPNFTEIPDSLFEGCTNLNSITIPNSVTTIGDKAFYDCDSLTSINIPALSALSARAFAECDNLETVTFDSSSTISTIEDNTFANCINLLSINIPNTVTEIKDLAFQSCESLPSITLPSGLLTIGDGAFVDCKKLNGISIPEYVTSIGEEAFFNCFSDSSLSNGVELRIYGESTINDRAFKDCTYLKTIYGPPGKAFESGSDNFNGCESLYYLNMTSCSSVTLSETMFINYASTNRIEIEFGWISTDNPKTVTLQSDSMDPISLAKTPHFSMMAPDINYANSSFTSSSLWCDKIVIVKNDHDAHYYQWDGNAFQDLGNTDPADWND